VLVIAVCAFELWCASKLLASDGACKAMGTAMAAMGGMFLVVTVFSLFASIKAMTADPATITPATPLGMSLSHLPRRAFCS
jgi:hypothetical protein